MTNYVITESSVHYVAAILDRVADKYPTKHHQDALNEFRNLSNRLLETLEEPMKVGIARHHLRNPHD